MKKIKMTSRMLSWFFRGLCFFIPLATMYLIFFNLEGMLNWGLLDSIISAGKVQHASEFSIGHRFILLIISALPLSITISICHKLAKLFRLYEQGYLFEESNIRLIKQISIFMIIGEIIQLIYQPLMTAALTFTNGSGQRFASITLGKANAATLITALIILVASWIIKEANQLKLESQLTI